MTLRTHPPLPEGSCLLSRERHHGLLGLCKDFLDKLSSCEPNSQLEEGTAEGKADVNQGGGHGVWKSHSRQVGDPG